MELRAWLFLLALVLLSLLYGMFRGNIESIEPFVAVCGKQAHEPRPISPLLCGEKIKLCEASVYDLAALPGISLKKARHIVAFFNEHPDANYTELLALPGIGQKMLVRLQNFFR